MTTTPDPFAPLPLDVPLDNLTLDPLTLREPGEVLAAIPYLLGFHPHESVVVMAVRGGQIAVNARVDLPPADTPTREMYGLVAHLLRVIRRQGATAAVIVGYGPVEQVSRVVLELDVALADAGVKVLDILRAHDGRYWSYLCQRAECCPPAGTPFDVDTSVVATRAVVSGCVALPDRQTLVRQIAPLEGEARAAMRAATERADRRLASGADDVLDLGAAAVDEALARQRQGGRLTDDEAAWLSVLISFPAVRDLAWEHLAEDRDPDRPGQHRALLMDLTRRAEPELVPAPGSLLALAAWMAGDGALASAALDRVLRVEPDYGLANLLAEAMDRGLPPSIMAGWAPPPRPVNPATAQRRRRRSSSRRAGSRQG